MRSVVEVPSLKNKKRKAKHNLKGRSQEQKILRSKQNDPLYRPTSTSLDNNDNYGNDGHDDNYHDPHDEDFGVPSKGSEFMEEKKVFSSKEASNLGRSIAGRREWQARHKKGKYNAKQEKKNAHRVAGSFSKAKALK